MKWAVSLFIITLPSARFAFCNESFMMPVLPAITKKILSQLHQTTSTPPHSLPSYQSSQSEVPLLDNLPEKEKRAATAELHRLAAEQPTTHLPAPCHRRFKWKTFTMVLLGVGLAAFAVVVSVVFAVDTDKNPDLVAKLRVANTNLDRMKLLPDDSDWFFDFTKQDKYTFSPGGVINANAATFPATVGQGMTLVSQFLRPPFL
jgi:hypothetical protein